MNGIQEQQAAQRDRNRSARGTEKFQRVTRIVKVQNLSAIPGPTASPQSLPVYWPSPGVVLWVVAAPSTVSTTDAYYAALTSLGLRIAIQGTTEFVTNGQSADYVQFSSIMPTAGFRFPINVEVKQNDTWLVYIRNLHASNSYTPDVAFGLAEY